jgi:hypothetical protein
MKHSAYVLAVLSILFIGSCTESRKDQKKKEKNLELTTDTLTYKAWTPLYEGADCGLEMSMEIEWPKKAVNTEVLEKMQKGISRLLFGDGLATTDVAFAMDAHNSATADLYMEYNSPEDALYDEYPEYTMSWFEEHKGRFLEPYKDMISYQAYVYGYSGGAHGNDAITCITFNRETGDVIRNEDLFIEGFENRLTSSLRANLLCSIDDTDMLFEKDILPHDNFYITSTGITYIYQRYEIGPYVLGIIEVTIPWKEINDILRPVSSQDNKSPMSPRVPS